MGFRKISVRESAATSIAEISWYLESEGLLATAEKFTDEAYDFIAKLGDKRKGYMMKSSCASSYFQNLFIGNQHQ